MKKNILLGGVLALIVIAIIFLQRSKTTIMTDGGVSQALACPPEQIRNDDGTCADPPRVDQSATASLQPTAAPAPAAPQPPAKTADQKSSQFEPGRELAGISGYFNLPEGKKSITLGELVGKKIILVDFWTYSCINCQRTLPYLNAWYEKYREQGLEIIGVHTPEFAFEKEPANVAAAIAKYNIKYPVVQDNDYATWTSYKNRYWPRKYLIDIDGYIVLDHIGEGGYEETERAIQLLLQERAQRLSIPAPVASGLSTPAAEKASAGTLSPETYFGSLRNINFGSSPVGKNGAQTFSAPTTPAKNTLYLSGLWNIMPEYATNQELNAKILFRYSAQNVFFVAQAAHPVTVRVLRDGKPLTADIAGEDVVISGGESTITIREARLYKVIKQAANEEHLLELIPQATGLEAFTFTFG